MDFILGWLEGLISPLLPTEIYSRLDMLYNGAIILLGVGVLLMLVSVICMIISVRISKKRAARA